MIFGRYAVKVNYKNDKWFVASFFSLKTKVIKTAIKKASDHFGDDRNLEIEWIVKL